VQHDHAMLTRADIRAWHVRTVLRRVYRLGGRPPANPLNEVVLRLAPPSMTSDEAAKYHRSNQHGR
jgi:hypothetical protein